MGYSFSVFSMLFLVTGLISLFVSFLAWNRRRMKGAKELTAMMLAAGLWAFADLFEISLLTMGDKIMWSKIEYLGSVLTPVFYLFFVLRFTGAEKVLASKWKYLVFAAPFITLILVFTNEAHNLIWTGFSSIERDTNIMQYYHGVGFYIGYMSYNYIILFVATVLLFRFILAKGGTFRMQGWIILVGSMLPWVASVIYMSNSSFLPGLSITPLSFALSGVLLIYAILYFRLLDLVPVAREQLVETLPDGILVIDLQGRIQDINASALEFLGMERKSILGEGLSDAMCEEEGIIGVLMNMEDGETTEVYSQRRKRAYLILKKGINQLSGGMLIILRDITEQKEYLDKLRRRDELLVAGSEISYLLLIEENTRNAVSKAIDMLGEASGHDRAYLFECDREGESGDVLVSQKYEWVKEGIEKEINNPDLQNMDFIKVAPFSYEMLSKGFIVDRDVENLPVESEREALSSQGIISVLLVPIHVEGKWWGFIGFDACEAEHEWMQGEKAILGTVASSIGSAIARRKAKDSLRESEERYSTIIGVSNTGAWEYYSEDDYLWCSPEYLTMLGYKTEEFNLDEKGNLDKLWTDLIHPDDREAAVRRFRDYLLSNTSEMYENYFRMKEKDGDWIWIWSRGRTMRDSTGELANLTVGTNIDITERKKAEEELISAKNKAERSDQLKTEFIHNISHEIRTPLNGIVGFGQLIAMEESTENERREFLDLLYKDTERLLNTIDDYLDISLLSSGNMKIINEECEIKGMLEEILQKVEERPREKNLSIRISYPETGRDARILADKSLMQKMVRHLVDNSIKYTKQGEIVIGYRTEGKSNLIYVKDTGIGIREDMVEKIFDPFVQEDSSSKKDYEGSGLGLAIVKGISELLGGEISVESKKNEGSVFCFRKDCE
ncbi:MAG: histidine kinase N-terminal 7TM domain-containing protein [Ignavibacteriaceae bacterium]